MDGVYTDKTMNDVYTDKAANDKPMNEKINADTAADAHASWNPWHGCTKLSAGCMHCYVYRRDSAFGVSEDSSVCRKTAAYDLPIKRRRDGSYKLAPDSTVYTCFTSDFLLSDADPWRAECWRMMRERGDCRFIFFTKRIDRLAGCLPDDWGDGYENVTVGCTVENSDMAAQRLPIFTALPLRHRIIVAEPLLGPLGLMEYLGGVEEVIVGGESGDGARVCDYVWVLELRRQCAEHGVAFTYHQTGARLRKDGRLYSIPRALQLSQAKRAGIDHDGQMKEYGEKQ